MKKNFTFRTLLVGGALASTALLGGTYLIEYGFKIDPCPLCLLQRYALWGVVLCFWLGVLQVHKSLWRLLYCFLIILFSTAGALIAGRQLWIQYLTPPNEMGGCIAGFEILFAYKPFFEALSEIFSASPDCARIDFTILKLPLSGWAFLSFAAIIMFCVKIVWLQIKRRI